MKKINTSTWKSYKISDVFLISRGKRLKKADHISGNVPYYSASKENNGLTDYIGNPLFIEKDAIICTTFGDCFFVKGDFTASDEITILKNENINEKNAFFICSVIHKAISKYDFSVKAFSSRIKDSVIYLPIINGKIDWKYMEEYIDEIKSFCNKKLEQNVISQEKNKIDSSNYKKFTIKDIFKCEQIANSYKTPTGGWLNKKELIENGSVPRITVSGVNNGIIGFFDADESNPNYRVYENFISVSFLGTVFYQKDKASLDMKVHCLQLKEKELSTELALFLISSIKAAFKNFSYSDQISSSVLADLDIWLPVDPVGNPDWKYMEEYIKTITDKCKLKLEKLVC